MIEIHNLSFGYGKGAPLFDGLNLKLSAGNIYGLLGKNGAGKSTLLKMISGLIFPKHGEIQVLGLTPKNRLPQLMSEIYLVTEEFHLPSVSLKNYVDLYSQFYPRFSQEAFEHYTESFDLTLDVNISNLSYGQKKKFLLSFGLATDCRLLILDEPTNGLDIPSKSQFRKVVASAIHEDRSFIISTHQVRDMENLIDPIMILDNGEIILQSSMNEITENLVASRQADVSNDKNVIYAESSLGGYTVVKKKTPDMEGTINLELFFKAAIHNKEDIAELFNKVSNEAG